MSLKALNDAVALFSQNIKQAIEKAGLTEAK